MLHICEQRLFRKPTCDLDPCISKDSAQFSAPSLQLINHELRVDAEHPSVDEHPPAYIYQPHNRFESRY